MAVSLSCVWAGIHYWLASRTIRKDLETFYAPGAAPVNATATSEV
jgi:hypothetical protein